MAAASAFRAQNADILRSLLHSVSQPLTTLHCALESSLGEHAESHSEEIYLALEETDRVIETVRLIREYLEADQERSSAATASVSLATKEVLEQLSSFADSHSVKLFGFGASNAQIAGRDIWLQRILVYLIESLIESVPASKAITVLLEDCMSESILSAYSLPLYAAPDEPAPAQPPNALRQAKIAIARRALESSGVSLEFESSEKAGFRIRIRKPVANQLSA